MSENQKYYYMKLKDNYFDDDSIVLLESMQDGIIYSHILLKMYLKSLKNCGKLQLDTGIPYNASMIATLTRQQVGTVERALQTFESLGLVEVLENGCFYLTKIELLIGKSSTEGERKKRARNEIQKQKLLGGHLSEDVVADICPKGSTDICPPNNANSNSEESPILGISAGVDICPPERELERELELEKELEKDIEIERELEREKGQHAQNTQHTHLLGRYKNVSLSPKEQAELKNEYPNQYETYVEKLSEYMASTGKQYISHIATIRKWVKEDYLKTKTRRNRPQNNDIRTYEYNGDDSL